MEVKLERLEVSSRVALDPLSPPGQKFHSKRSANRLPKLLAASLLALAVTVPAARADEPSEKPDSDESSFQFGAEYLLALRAATAVWTGPVEQALALLGTPYRLGGTNRAGIDCSGLIGLVFRHEGLSLPRTAAEQFRIGSPVEIDDLRAGDIVFFANTYKRGISHVGLYIGDGKFIHAENRRRGVVITSLADKYYRSRFAGARRLIRTPGDGLMAAADRLSGKAETTEELAVR